MMHDTEVIKGVHPRILLSNCHLWRAKFCHTSCPAGEYGQPPEFFNNPQMHSYEHCLQSYGSQHQFLGGLLQVSLPA